MSDNTATLIADNGQTRHYRCEPRMAARENITNDSIEYHRYVVVSGVDNSFATETYIFPADEDGEITSFGEMPGSFQGYVDHDQALINAGYTVVKGES